MKQPVDPNALIDILTDGLNAADDVLAFLEAKKDDPTLPSLLGPSVGLILQTANHFTRRAGAFWKGCLEAGYTIEDLASVVGVTPQDIQDTIDADDARKQAKEQWSQAGKVRQVSTGFQGFKPRKQTPKRNAHRRK